MHLRKMDNLCGTNEIVESVEELYSELKVDENFQQHHILKAKQKYSIEDDINRLFDAIDTRSSRTRLASLQQSATDVLQRSAMKRPVRPGFAQSSGIGISASVSLKQALRGLCLSQASEMAAMKRLAKTSQLSGASEAGAIKRLYRAVVIEASESGHPLTEAKGNLVEISLVPEISALNFSKIIPDSQHVSNEGKSNQDTRSALLSSSSAQEAKCDKTVPPDENFPLPTGINAKKSTESVQNRKLKVEHSVFPAHSSPKLPVRDDSPTAQSSVASARQGKEPKVNLHFATSPPISKTGSKDTNSASSGPRLTELIIGNKKLKSDSNTVTDSSNQCIRLSSNNPSLCTSKIDCDKSANVLKNKSSGKEKASPSPICTNVRIEASSSVLDSCAGKPGLFSDFSSRSKTLVSKIDGRLKSREKGEILQSSKSSHGEVSSSRSCSEESNLSGSNHSGQRPHMSKDIRWEAVHCLQKQHGSLCLRHFKLLRKLGGGDIGTVYLAELIGTNCLYALKIMDNEFLAVRKKLTRAQTEIEILQMLDHPFLPTLFSHFTTDKFSCLVMEYCSGGDLHMLRQRQTVKSFCEEAARFYVAEVLLALEYLHMLGVVYRDLKPENILVREDGHIMLSDFDLSLRCTVNPTLIKSFSHVIEPSKRVSNPCADSSCIEPFCLQPSCFTPRLLSAATKARKLKPDLAAQVSPLPQLVVEPTNARSNSFVGTHEYLSPEIIKGHGHGSAVDWWTFGIFLYELLYGKTPFKGLTNDETLANVVSKCLKFPESPMVSSHARDLIRRLLQKEPANRLGSEKGATEIKQHPFFDGLNWALIRCATPPELPRLHDHDSAAIDMSPQSKYTCKSQKECKNYPGVDSEFEMF